MNSSPPGTPPAKTKRTWWPGLVIVLLAVVAFAALVVIEEFEWVTPQNANLGRVSSVGALGIALFAWFVFRSPAERPIRLRIGFAGLAVVAIALSMFKIVGVSGNIVPIIRFRWSPTADAVLPKIGNLAAETAPADLTTTGPFDFPQFLGPNATATLDNVELARDWKSHPPKLVWRQAIGAAWSGFAIVGDFAVTQEQRGEQELVTCYAVATGDLVWSQANDVRFADTVAGVGPRATPTIHQGKVYTLGATGIFQCLEGATGKLLWRHNIVEESGATVPAWGKSCSPLVWRHLVIVSAGGPRGKSLLAFDQESGALVWGGGDEPSSYASPKLVTLAGQEQVVMINVNGIASHDPADGRVLWQHPFPGEDPGNPSCSQPIALGNDAEGRDLLLCSKGYSNGSTLLAVQKRDAGWKVVQIWKSRELKTKFTNGVIRNGFAYALDEGMLECVDLATGKRRWKQGRYGHGQVLLVNDLLLVQSETGDLALVDPQPDAFQELAIFPALAGTCWNTLALSGNRLLLRSNEEAVRYDLQLRD